MLANQVFSSTKKTVEDKGCGYAILLCIVLLALAFGFDCLIVWACMALWNGCLLAAMPTVTAEVSYWQMWGIYLLFSLFFRSSSTINTSKD